MSKSFCGVQRCCLQLSEQPRNSLGCRLTASASCAGEPSVIPGFWDDTAAPFRDSRGRWAGTGATWKEEIRSKALTALAWRLNPSEAIQLLLLQDIWLCVPCPAPPAPEGHSSTVSAPRATQHGSKPTLSPTVRLAPALEPPRAGAAAARGGSVTLCPARAALGPCHPNTRGWRPTELGSPRAIDSSILQLGIKILLGLKMAGLSTEQRKNLRLLLS